MEYKENSYYHIYNRGAHRQKIFFEGENYRYLTTLFLKNSARYSVTVAAYCLMPNHYHLVLKQKQLGSIGSFLRTTFNTYTQAVNMRLGISGTLFQGQAKGKEITTDAYCLRVIRYVHLNPVAAKLVTSVEDWPFSNYLEWVDKRRSPLVDTELRASYFPNPEEYREFVKGYRMEKERSDMSDFLFDEE